MEQIPPSSLQFAITYAIRHRARIGGKKIREGDSESVARTIIEHLNLCGWTVWHEPMKPHSIGSKPDTVKVPLDRQRAGEASQ